MVAPEAGAVVDAAVGGKLLDGVHRPAARRALLRGAAPRPRHPLAVAALLLLRRSEGSRREKMERGKEEEATATGGVDDWRRWKRKERRGQHSSGGLCVVEGEGEAWENNGGADGELVRTAAGVRSRACFCQKRSELLRTPPQAACREFRDVSVVYF